MDTANGGPPGSEHSIQVRMLGPLTICRDGVAAEWPASRKVRALFAHLALAPRPVTRTQLCEMLWDQTDDPRGELRWCLSKIRRLIDDGERRRVISSADAVQLDLTDCFVDAIEIARATREGIERLAPERSRALHLLFDGDFLEALNVEHSPVFNGWLTAQRRRFRGTHAALLEHLVGSASGEEAFGYLEKWLQLAPFDRRVHEVLLTELARLGRIQEGEKHLAATAALFETEGLDCNPIRDRWQAARAQKIGPPHIETARLPSPVEKLGPRDGVADLAARRASIAVMPLHDLSIDGSGARCAAAGDALVHDVITRLAKLRSLFVIAQGTVFALHKRHVGAEEAGRMLNVDYVFSGSVRLEGKRLTVAVELAETRSARIVWTETFKHTLNEVFMVLDEIGNRIVASVASEIETIERNRAILKPPNSLDAWEAHHRGLWHVYRFNESDNDRARHFFAMAVRLDPTFARAYAGLSFAHFQNAFQGWTKREPEIDRAFEAANQSLMADDRDPAAHWAMGRALWLRGRNDQSVTELERAIDLSPNFALGHYTLAFVQSQSGDPDAAISSSDHSRNLSPFDPLLFGMLGSRAIALVRLGRFDEAADWAVRAAARPNAHSHIFAVAAYSLALAGRLDDARAYAATILGMRPRYNLADFLGAFRFEADGAELFRDGAKRLQMA